MHNLKQFLSYLTNVLVLVFPLLALFGIMNIEQAIMLGMGAIVLNGVRAIAVAHWLKCRGN